MGLNRIKSELEYFLAIYSITRLYDNTPHDPLWLDKDGKTVDFTTHAL
jgi:hypothetical protein